jgi:hypothetical protein
MPSRSKPDASDFAPAMRLGICRFHVDSPRRDVDRILDPSTMPYEIDRDNASWRVVDGEAVIINLTSTHYYGLNETGTFVWCLLAERAMTVREVAAAVAAEWGEAVETVMPDVEAILQGLVAEQLVKEV